MQLDFIAVMATSWCSTNVLRQHVSFGRRYLENKKYAMKHITK